MSERGKARKKGRCGEGEFLYLIVLVPKWPAGGKRADITSRLELRDWGKTGG